MVSVEEKSTFLSDLQKSPVAKDSIAFLFGEKVSKRAWNRGLTADIASESLFCFINDDRKGFVDLYAELTRRNPDSETDWIYDDFVIFALVCCCRRFSVESTWLKNIITLRNDLKKDGAKNLPATFLSILNENYDSKDNFYEAILCFKDKLHERNFREDKLNQLFLDLYRTPFPFYKGPFLNLVALKAIEIIIEAKGLQDPQVKEFVGRFESRVQKVSRFVGNCVFWILVALLMWTMYITLPQNENGFRLIALLVTALFGLGISEWTAWRKKIIRIVEQTTKKFWGYQIDSHDVRRSEEDI